MAVSKARNVNYYNDAARLQPEDQVPGLPAGAALTNRTFRYLGLPRFPEGIDGTPPGPFSQLNDGGANPRTGLNTGAPLPASAFQSVVGFDAFNPGTNFRDRTTDPRNQNGIVFFPGSSTVYRNGVIVGGFGISGDGVDQDDVVGLPGNRLEDAHGRRRPRPLGPVPQALERFPVDVVRVHPSLPLERGGEEQGLSTRAGAEVEDAHCGPCTYERAGELAPLVLDLEQTLLV